jgi:hypothetical protein
MQNDALLLFKIVAVANNKEYGRWQLAAVILSPPLSLQHQHLLL